MKASYLRRIVTSVSVASTLLAVPAPANAAVDMFLNLAGIKGESKDAKHPGEIDVLAWSWGESNNPVAVKKNRNGLPVPDCIQDLSLTKYIDRSTPDIIMDAVLGNNIQDATLTMRKAGTQPMEFLVLKMTGVSISSYNTGGSGGEDRLTENVSLHFQKLEGTYRQQLQDGSAGPPLVFTVEGAACTTP